MYLNLSIFTVFLKNRNFISKIRRSKVTDYAALKQFFDVAIIKCLKAKHSKGLYQTGSKITMIMIMPP